MAKIWANNNQKYNIHKWKFKSLTCFQITTHPINKILKATKKKFSTSHFAFQIIQIPYSYPRYLRRFRLVSALYNSIRCFSPNSPPAIELLSLENADSGVPNIFFNPQYLNCVKYPNVSINTATAMSTQSAMWISTNNWESMSRATYQLTKQIQAFVHKF